MGFKFPSSLFFGSFTHGLIGQIFIRLARPNPQAREYHFRFEIKTNKEAGLPSPHHTEEMPSSATFFRLVQGGLSSPQCACLESKLGSVQPLVMDYRIENKWYS